MSAARTVKLPESFFVIRGNFVLDLLDLPAVSHFWGPIQGTWGNLGTFTTLRGKKGAEEFIAMQRTLQTHQKTLGVLRGAVIWGYLGLACRLSGCGGWI
jgi:hypothetical protein